MGKLTDKQKMFCEEYLVDLNGTQAAIRAGYSKKTAKEQAAQNLAKLNIQNYISELKDKRNKRLEIDQNEVLKELYNWAYGDFTELMLLTFEEVKALPDEVRRLITGFERTITTFGQDGEGTKEKLKITFVNKERAMDMINKHIGLYEKDNEQKTPNQINVTLGD